MTAPEDNLVGTNPEDHEVSTNQDHHVVRTAPEDHLVVTNPEPEVIVGQQQLMQWVQVSYMGINYPGVLKEVKDDEYRVNFEIS